MAKFKQGDEVTVSRRINGETFTIVGMIRSVDGSRASIRVLYKDTTPAFRWRVGGSKSWSSDKYVFWTGIRSLSEVTIQDDVDNWI